MLFVKSWIGWWLWTMKYLVVVNRETTKNGRETVKPRENDHELHVEDKKILRETVKPDPLSVSSVSFVKYLWEFVNLGEGRGRRPLHLAREKLVCLQSTWDRNLVDHFSVKWLPLPHLPVEHFCSNKFFPFLWNNTSKNCGILYQKRIQYEESAIIDCVTPYWPLCFHLFHKSIDLTFFVDLKKSLQNRK